MSARRRRRRRHCVLRGMDDEAGASLMLGSLGIYIIHKLLSKAARYAVVLSALASQLFLHLLYVKQLEDVAYILIWDRTLLLWSFVLWTWCTWVLGAYVAAVVLGQVLRSLFGRELIWRSARCEVIAQTTPDFSAASR